MTRDDAVRAINAWLDATLTAAKALAAQPGSISDEIDAFVANTLVRTAAGYGLALTDDGGEPVL